jgi:hypothetical protein
MTTLADKIADDFQNWEIVYRIHATHRMFERNISEDDILLVLEQGAIIEEYHDDFPFPSILINGRSIAEQPLHVIVGIDRSEKRLYIITTYEPDATKWTDNFSRRRV